MKMQFTSSLSAAFVGSLALFALAPESAQAATLFTEDFSDNSASPNMALGTGFGSPTTDFTGDFTITSGDNNRIYLGTNDSDYSTIDFTFAATVTMTASTSAWAIPFFGMGDADANAVFFGEPGLPGLFSNLLPGGDAQYKNNETTTQTFWATGTGSLASGTHRVQMEWDATAQQAIFRLDVGNDGGGTFDFSSSAISPSFAFNSSNSQLFVGGGAGVSWDNISIVPEPSSLALVGLVGLAGLLMAGRRRS